MSDTVRKLAAIMFTDMVGFTSLMQTDEKTGLQKRARHKEVIENTHKKYNGEIVQYFGDGTLSIFTNSVDAVKCAVDIQKDLKNPIEVPLRIGIHSLNLRVGMKNIIILMCAYVKLLNKSLSMNYRRAPYDRQQT